MTTAYAALAPAGHSHRVAAVRLDEALDDRQEDTHRQRFAIPDVIKLDVEGAEMIALRGASSLLQSDCPPALIVEHNHVTSAAAGFGAADLFRFVTTTQPRYRFYWIGTRLRPIPSADALAAIRRQGNVLIRAEPR
jgi:hypothetical protein